MDDLRIWFFNNKKPFFNLRYFIPGRTGDTILRNEDEQEMESAWALLSNMVTSLSKAGRTQLNLIVYDKGKANNYAGLVNLDFQAGAQMPGQLPGIAGIPDGYVSRAEISGIMNAEREKWEMKAEIEALRAQLEAPKDDDIERITGLIERLAATPLGMAFVQKMMGGSMPPMAMAQPVNGIPNAQTDNEPEDNFDDDIEATTKILGVPDTELAAKLRRFAETNPEMAKQLFNQV